MSGLYPLLNDGRDRHSAVVTSKSTKEPRIEGVLGRGYDPTQEKQRYDDSRCTILPLKFWWMISFASRVVHSSQTPSPSHPHIWLGLSGRTKLRHTQEFWENESEKQEFLTDICQHSNSNPNSVAHHECQSPKNWEESSKKWEESPNCYWEEYSKFVGNLQKVWGIAKIIVDS